MDKRTEPEIHEAVWTVERVQIAGVVSGPESGLPVLALHGWLDNAASFDALRAHLPEVRLVAIDMPGHGLSGHRSADSGYQIWDDLPQLVGLLDQLGWKQCVLLGHSRGAMIATLLAATLPERVQALITLDGMLPFPAEDASVIDQMRKFLKDRHMQSHKPVRVFSSIEDYVARRARSGEPETIARQLAKRALKPTASGYEWRGDPRLSGASALKLNQPQIEAMLRELSMPVLNIWATPGERMKKLSEAARATAAQFVSELTCAEIPGHHHWHMEAESAEAIAMCISEFLYQRS